MKQFFDDFPGTSHPMATLSSFMVMIVGEMGVSIVLAYLGFLDGGW